MKKKKKDNEIKPRKRHIFLKILLVLLLLSAGALAYFHFSVKSITPERGEEYARFTGIINILLIGADYNEVGISEGRSDTIMLISLDMDDKDIFVMSIPRDTYAAVEGHGKTKINHAFAYGGVELLINSVENLLGIPIDYYAATNFAGFETVIDAMGGIDIEVDKDMDYETYYDHIRLEQGLQHLDGKQALQFVRYRQDKMGDLKRVERQQLFMQAVIKKMTSAQGILSLPAVASAAFDMVDTDLKKTDLISLAGNIVLWDLSEISMQTLPGEFTVMDELSYWKVDRAALDALLQEKFHE